MRRISALVTAAGLLALSAGCAASPPHAAPAPVVTVAAPVAVTKRAVPAPVRTPATEAMPAPEPAAAPAPPAAEVGAPPAELGVLTIPALAFRAVHTEVIQPDAAGIVRPTTRDGLARVTAEGVAAELWAVHSGGRAGDGPGGVLTDGDPAAFVGAAATLPDGAAAVVTDAWVSDKGDTVARLDAVLRDPTAVVLVTCQVQAAARSTHNVVLVLARRA